MCKALRVLPDSLGQLSALQNFNLTYCSTLDALPDSLGRLSALQHLDLSCCSSLTALPDSAGQLSSLQQLHLAQCSLLVSLPRSFGQLPLLQRLNLIGNSSLTTLPDSMAQLAIMNLEPSALTEYSGSLTGPPDIPSWVWVNLNTAALVNAAEMNICLKVIERDDQSLSCRLIMRHLRKGCDRVVSHRLR